MKVLGIGCFFTHRHKDFYPNVPQWFFHDSAAALVVNGEVVCAAEEERFSRIKHTNKFAIGAVQYCLKESRLTLADIDIVAFHFEEDFADRELDLQYLEHSAVPRKLSRQRLIEMLTEATGEVLDPCKIMYVPHHDTHACAAFFHSGFTDALVAVFDGQGERDSATIYLGTGRELRRVAGYPETRSLGHLYSQTTQFLGFGQFDEYKVMGLAPYGDRSVYRELFRSIFQLLPDGNYELELGGLRDRLLDSGVVPRRNTEGFESCHMDLAAALQEVVEIIGQHVTHYWADKLGQRRLCLAGGVAHNCSMNGHLLRTGKFENIFVHPAAHDGGAALGAAMAVCRSMSPSTFEPKRLTSVFWGTSIGTDNEVASILSRWSPCVEMIRSDDVCRDSAALLAEDKIIGWYQGRSEFGPRALGNRSILADPRPAGNKDRVNAAIKKREAFRPFAPAIEDARVHDYFELPRNCQELPYMNITARVRPEMRTLLGAVTHIDGTARLQTVDNVRNPRFYGLVKEFGRLTGTPIVLNTSFNNHAEPIVDTIEDALACFLTTGLDCLVIGDWIVSKRQITWEAYLDCIISLRPTMELVSRDIHSAEGLTEQQAKDIGGRRRKTVYEARFTYTKGRTLQIRNATFEALALANGRKTLSQVIQESGTNEDRSRIVVEDVIRLWELRFIVIDWHVTARPIKNRSGSTEI